MATSITDADGKFALKLSKAGKYAIAAKSTRRVFDKTEEYYWLFWIVVNGDPKSIMLSNNNLTDSGSTDSLIQTAKY